jgi:hypothetical protein
MASTKRSKTHSFKAKIYKVGINWCVDVPAAITGKMTPDKGRIRIKGLINGFDFSTTLMPVKDAPYRLYVNAIMMKGGNTALGKTAAFTIEANTEKKVEIDYPMHEALGRQLTKNKLTNDFENLTHARKRDVLKYLHAVKREETLHRNVDSVIEQLKRKEKSVRIPLKNN